MKNKRVLIISLILILLIGITSFLLFSYEEEYLEADTSLFAIMLEKDDGTYLESDITSFPSEGYTFNSELSYCVNGSNIEYNDVVDKARIDTTGSEKCFMYFNKDIQEVYNFDYTGNYQTFVVPKTGKYRIELWGASGYLSLGGGAYTKGDITLNEGETIYVYVGEGNKTTGNTTSFNGGTGSSGGYPGGGATDVRLVSGTWNNVISLRSRIMVAGGSGSGSGNNTTTKGAAGGLTGYTGGTSTGGTQVSAGTGNYGGSIFGEGNGGCAGGGGYYGGGGASCSAGAGGGSSYISGHTGSVAITSASSSVPKSGCTTGTTDNACSVHYSGKVFTGTFMYDGAGKLWYNEIYFGSNKMPSSTGKYYETGKGHMGNGYAKITYLNNYNTKTTYTDLTNIRYIKSCMNGSDGIYGNYWTELEAIKEGVNIALNKSVTGTGAEHVNHVLSNLVDGIYNNFAYLSNYACVTVDLGQVHNLDRLVIYPYYGNYRKSYDHTFSVGATNASGTTSLSKILIDNRSDLLSTSSGFKFAQEW